MTIIQENTDVVLTTNVILCLEKRNFFQLYFTPLLVRMHVSLSKILMVKKIVFQTTKRNTLAFQKIFMMVKIN